MDSGINIKEELKKILSLQRLDGEIYDIKEELEGMPVREAMIDSSLEGKKAGMQQAENELKRLQVLKGEKEMDIEAKEGKVTKYQADLYSIKNNKEFQALKQEISSIKADISLVEDELLVLFDTIEAAREKLEVEKKKFQDEEKASAQEKTVIKNRENELKAALQERSAARSETAADIAPEVLSEYQKILEKWGKNALSSLSGEFCAECNMQLRPQIINEVKLGRNIVICENCARILYVEE